MVADPGRLEYLLVSNQVDSYCRQVQDFTGLSFSKMFVSSAVRTGANDA